MAERKGKSPDDKDFQRWAEAINNPEIIDRNTFDNEWKKYFQEDARGNNIIKNKKYQDATFGFLLGKRKDINPERIVKNIPRSK